MKLNEAIELFEGCPVVDDVIRNNNFFSYDVALLNALEGKEVDVEDVKVFRRANVDSRTAVRYVEDGWWCTDPFLGVSRSVFVYVWQIL
jgi:hypothetical protein